MNRSTLAEADAAEKGRFGVARRGRRLLVRGLVASVNFYSRVAPYV